MSMPHMFNMEDVQNDLDDDEIHGKKRKNEKEWKANKRKSLRAEGKEYVSTRGKVVAARTTGTKCRCRRQCLESFSDETKVMLLEKFNMLAEQRAQDAFLSGGISTATIQRRRARNEDGHQRNVHVTYKVQHGEEQKVVCRSGYASLYGVSEKRIRRIVSAVMAGTIPIDNRGKHNNRPNAISEDNKRLIDQHIRAFPYQISHYGRELTKRRYLSSELSVRRMYILFLERHFPDAYAQVQTGAVEPESVECPIKHRIYYNYFKDNFNYGFGRPRTDVCGTSGQSCTTPIPIKPAQKDDVVKLRKYLSEATQHLIDQLVKTEDGNDDVDNTDYED
ncbi:hypothetical protein GJAV_G00201380 [Gymnothorax javanicus]|nr:hypothetical protein GJAV_G00201380 [Gymnothorax javanicus]